MSCSKRPTQSREQEGEGPALPWGPALCASHGFLATPPSAPQGGSAVCAGAAGRPPSSRPLPPDITASATCSHQCSQWAPCSNTSSGWAPAPQACRQPSGAPSPSLCRPRSESALPEAPSARSRSAQGCQRPDTTYRLGRHLPCSLPFLENRLFSLSGTLRNSSLPFKFQTSLFCYESAFFNKATCLPCRALSPWDPGLTQDNRELEVGDVPFPYRPPWPLAGCQLCEATPGKDGSSPSSCAASFRRKDEKSSECGLCFGAGSRPLRQPGCRETLPRSRPPRVGTFCRPRAFRPPGGGGPKEKARWVSPPFPRLLRPRFRRTWRLMQGHSG